MPYNYFMYRNFLFPVFIFLLITDLSASFSAECVLKVRILQTEGAAQIENGIIQRNISFQVLKIRSQSGHQKHCSHWNNKIFNAINIHSGSIKNPVEIKNGDIAILHFKTETSEIISKNRVVKMKNRAQWRIRPWSFLDNF